MEGYWARFTLCSLVLMTALQRAGRAISPAPLNWRARQASAGLFCYNCKTANSEAIATERFFKDSGKSYVLLRSVFWQMDQQFGKQFGEFY
jgi:hypothetical protein